MERLIGVDVSVFNGTIDWKKVKADGIEFAILKATQGKDAKYPNGFVDSTFERNYKDAKAAGIKLGVYHFAVFTNESQSKEEAKQFLDAIKGKTFEYPLCLDLEDLPGGRSPILTKVLTKKQLTDYSIIFFDELIKNGHRVMLYTNTDWRTSKLDYSRLSQYNLWQAHYPFGYLEKTMDFLNANRPKAIDNKVSIWQCTSMGKVNGITGNVDMNFDYVGMSNTLSTPNPIAPTKPNDPQFNMNDKVRVKSGSKWSNGVGIASFVFNSDMYIVSNISNDKTVCISTSKGGAITGRISIDNLTELQ